MPSKNLGFGCQVELRTLTYNFDCLLVIQGDCLPLRSTLPTNARM